MACFSANNDAESDDHVGGSEAANALANIGDF